MTIIGLSLEATRDYVSKHDKGEGPDKTTWVLGTLDSRIMGMLKDKATSILIDPSKPTEEVETTINAAEYNFQVVMFGLKGFSNFMGEDGEIEYKSKGRRHGGRSYDVCDEDVMRRIPQAVLTDLADEITKDNMLSEDEIKN